MFKDRLETEHLILTKARLSDYKDLYKNYWSQEDTAKYMLWRVCKSEIEAKEKLSRMLNSQNSNIIFIVYEKQSQEAIGTAGIREVEPHIFEDAGIGIGNKFTRKGYGKEILNCLVSYCFNELGAQKIICKCDRRNISSSKLQLSCGFNYSRSEETIKKKDNEKFIADFYELTKENYLKLNRSHIKNK